MSALQSLETKLEDLFVKQAPALPPNGKKAIVEWLPWINLVLGLLALYSTYVLWHWANVANQAADYLNDLSAAYGVNASLDIDRLTVMVWVGLIVLGVEALLYLAAFPGLRDKKKSGWNLLFYAALLNIVYGLIVLFTDYGGVGNFLGSLIGSAIGLYFLFQIRSLYHGAKTAPAKK